MKRHLTFMRDFHLSLSLSLSYYIIFLNYRAAYEGDRIPIAQMIAICMITSSLVYMELDFIPNTNGKLVAKHFPRLVICGHCVMYHINCRSSYFMCDVLSQ
ncbi:hypothetical protein KP509_31G064600 [Ceratopteris richardii]|uniref:Uncharacterized protein n=1 Tax=Ceratopteris richardii TaxID=49495 RepID=A0A8T2QYS3_CERRI|nr:hypothetical protein KP509_31G064600 [Ceratopteris richardii]